MDGPAVFGMFGFESAGSDVRKTRRESRQQGAYEGPAVDFTYVVVLTVRFWSSVPLLRVQRPSLTLMRE